MSVLYDYQTHAGRVSFNYRYYLQLTRKHDAWMSLCLFDSVLCLALMCSLTTQHAAACRHTAFITTGMTGMLFLSWMCMCLWDTAYLSSYQWCRDYITIRDIFLPVFWTATAAEMVTVWVFSTYRCFYRSEILLLKQLHTTLFLLGKKIKLCTSVVHRQTHTVTFQPPKKASGL